jgi:hypothetical protein
MLKEIDGVRQDDPTLRRRWFQDHYFDLFVWQSAKSAIVAFQLCYDIPSQERVLSWRDASGFSHHRIDSGEATPERNMSPILVSDGILPVDEVLPRFVRHARDIDHAVGRFIAGKLREYAGEPGPRAESGRRPLRPHLTIRPSRGNV